MPLDGGHVRLGVLGASLVAALALVTACGAGAEKAKESPRGVKGAPNSAGAGVAGQSGEDASVAAGTPPLNWRRTAG
ncbi:hypothetical protein AB0B50_44000 [Streptomyces sp. NPDC041068]|uniref:hypothetical protein n=1 Tax=Streptomyces sp. NPDC041068 TaxID=3155130 RepID=UPI0033DA8C05